MPTDTGKEYLHSVTLGQGPPLLFLHGFGGSIFSWREVQAPLAERHQVILADLKGCGESPKPNDGRYAPTDQAALVHEFILGRDLRNLVLVGHSYGGVVALLTALKLREETPGRLRALILIDSVAYPQRVPLFLRLLKIPLLGSLGLRLLPPEVNIRYVLKECYFDPARITDAQVAGYASPLRTAAGKRALASIAKQFPTSGYDEYIEKYPTLDLPTLILWGTNDTLVPLQIGRRLKNALPAATMFEVNACGHIPHEEKPEETLGHLSSFLADLDTNPAPRT